MEAIKISSFGRNEIQNAEWYATSIEQLATAEGSCIGDKGYLLVENMPMYIKKSNSNNQEDWQFVGNKYGGGGAGDTPDVSEYITTHNEDLEAHLVIQEQMRTETLQMLTDLGIAQFASEDGETLYTDNKENIYVL